MGWNHQPHTSNVWYIYLNLVDFNDKLNVGKYTIHGSYGNYSCCFDFCFDVSTNVHTQLFQHWQIARCLVFPVEGAIDNWMCRGAEAVGKWRPCESLGERSRSPGIFMYFPTQWRACFFEPRNHQNHGVGVHTIDGRNPANQLRFVVYPILVEKNPRWLFGMSEPSTVGIPSRVMKLPSTVGKVRIQKDSLNHQEFQVPKLNLRMLFFGGQTCCLLH